MNGYRARRYYRYCWLWGSFCLSFYVRIAFLVLESTSSSFSCSSILDHEWRQAVTAAGSRCIAALSVKRYLVGNDLLVEFHQLQTEEVKKGLTDRDALEGFDITLTKHKGLVCSAKVVP